MMAVVPRVLLQAEQPPTEPGWKLAEEISSDPEHWDFFGQETSSKDRAIHWKNHTRHENKNIGARFRYKGASEEGAFRHILDTDKSRQLQMFGHRLDFVPKCSAQKLAEPVFQQDFRVLENSKLGRANIEIELE